MSQRPKPLLKRLGWPDVVAIEANVLPAERGNVGEQLVRQRLALGAKLCNGTAEVDGVPEDDGGRIAILDDLWITSDRREKGLGARLLKAVCENLQTIGARAVVLEVDPANKSAMALYSRSGFVKTGTASYAKGFAQG